MKILKKVIPSIVKKTLYGLYVKIGSFYRKYRILKYAKTYPLIKNPRDIFPVLARISDASWNKMYTPEIFGICKERTMEAIFPELEFYSMKNATISLGSDIISTEHGVWWDKYNEEDFMTYVLLLTTMLLVIHLTLLESFHQGNSNLFVERL